MAPSGRGAARNLSLVLSFFTVAACTGLSMAAQVTLSNLEQGYTGSGKSVTVTTVPAGLNYTVTYAGSTTLPVNLGTYAVVVTIVDPMETGSATGNLVIVKGAQTLAIQGLTSKTYGDAPFTVTATANTGIPITEWQSSDPAVASVTPNGLVTVLGAGQTSIIAINAGNSNYNAGWVARPLNVARSLAPVPSGTETVTFNNAAQPLDPSALPSGLATEITYREITVAEPVAPTPQVVWQNGPDTLALSYLSTAVQATSTWALAKYARLAGTARKLHSCEVTLVNWAGYLGGRNNDPVYRYKEWADANPDLVVIPQSGISIPGNSGGFYHPVTLSFHDYVNEAGSSESYRLLTSATVLAFIPWRPVTLADGVTAYQNSGYAFRVPFSFPDGIILPDDVWISVSFNTSTQGVAPIGVTGPYDALNIARSESNSIGTSLLSGTLLYRNWRWQSASGVTGPMLRLRTIPTTSTANAPVNAGTYEVKSKPAAFGLEPWAVSTRVVNKAPLAIQLANLTQIRNGDPKPVITTTTPAGIATGVTYAGLSVAPSALGSYPVVATSANPNYQGQAVGTLQIGDSFASWQTASFLASSLPAEQRADIADPDGDGLSNFLEYASNLNPLSGDSAPVRFENEGLVLAFTYRRNLHALDLDYSIQDTSTLGDPSSWGPVTPLSEFTVSDDGSTRVIRAVVAKPVGQPSYFLRLKTRR